MEKGKVSIVLPVYNGEEYLELSIRSVISQTYSDWELIIVNDCSTDNTLKICNTYAMSDDRIRVISNDKNLKLPMSLNVGFDFAQGEFYTWISDDNLYSENAIEVMINVMKEEPNVAMVYADYTNIDCQGNTVSYEKLLEPKYIVTGNICGACFMYRAEVAQKVGRYDPDLFLAEDYDYWVRIYRYGIIKHIPENLYSYRIHSRSLTQINEERIKEQTYKMLEKNFLVLYVSAKRNHLIRAFFNYMTELKTQNKEEVRGILEEVNYGYALYLKLRGIKRAIKRK